MEKKSLYFKALSTYGIDAQMWVLVEECGELLNAIAKIKRGRATKEDVIDELADVSIMVKQIACAIDYDAYLKRQEEKLLRLAKRLEKHK